MDLIDFSHNRIVLNAKIEYSFESKGTFLRNEEYEAEIKSVVSNVILYELPKELKDYGILFDTKIFEIRKGCIDVDILIQNLVLLASLAKTAYDVISQFEAFSKSIKLISTKCEDLLRNALRKMGVSSTVKAKPKKINYADGAALVNCDCDRLCAELSDCARTLETSLTKSGAILGQDFTKLDCFKLAMELMKNCRQFNHLP